MAAASWNYKLQLFSQKDELPVDFQLECINTIFTVQPGSRQGIQALEYIYMYRKKTASIQLLNLVVTAHMTIFDTEIDNDFWKTGEENRFLEERWGLGWEQPTGALKQDNEESSPSRHSYLFPPVAAFSLLLLRQALHVCSFLSSCSL